MPNNYQLETMMSGYAEALGRSLSAGFPYISVHSKTDGNDSLVAVDWHVITPPEISRLRVETARSGEGKTIWVRGEFYLPLAQAGLLSDPAAVYNQNPGVSYIERLPFSMPELGERMKHLPFEKDTRATLDYRVGEIRRHMKETVRKVRDQYGMLGLVLDQAPYSLIAGNATLFEEIEMTLYRLLEQAALGGLNLRDIENLSETDFPLKLPHGMKRKQLEKGKA